MILSTPDEIDKRFKLKYQATVKGQTTVIIYCKCEFTGTLLQSARCIYISKS